MIYEILMNTIKNFQDEYCSYWFLQSHSMELLFLEYFCSQHPKLSKNVGLLFLQQSLNFCENSFAKPVKLPRCFHPTLPRSSNPFYIVDGHDGPSWGHATVARVVRVCNRQHLHQVGIRRSLWTSMNFWPSRVATGRKCGLPRQESECVIASERHSSTLLLYG